MAAADDHVLAQSTQHLFEAVLQHVGEAVPWARGGNVAGELELSSIASRAAFGGMPGRVT